MKSIYLLSLLSALAVQAVAQVHVQDESMTQTTAQEVADIAAQREQRRAALRTALKQQPHVLAPGEQRKQFSEQERYALRQQVREQQNVGKSRP